MSNIFPVSHSDINAWLEIADQAQLDHQIQSETPWLLGVKANIGVRGFRRSAGCAALDKAPEPADAPVVAALRHAGAVVAGTTNMHELALGVTTCNAVYGAARVPGHLDHAPGGSSGGSAAAVAHSDVDAALATDTGGSVSIPAALCGVTGFRPSTGRWPTAGIVGLSTTRDTPGIITTSISRARAIDRLVTRTAAADTTLPTRPRLGLPAELCADLHPATQTAFNAAIKRLADTVDLVDIAYQDILSLANDAAGPIVMREARQLLTGTAAEVLDIAPSQAFETLVRRIDSADVRAALQAEVAAPVSDQIYAQAQDMTCEARQRYADLLHAHELDGLIFPTTPAPAPQVDPDPVITHLGRETTTFMLYTRNTGQGSMLGAPMATVALPVDTGGLPVGLTIQGKRFRDHASLDIAALIEAALMS